MNWRRGFFRAWLLVSALYVVVLGFVLSDHLFSPEPKDWPPGTVLTVDEFYAPAPAPGAAVVARRLGFFALLSGVPPVAVLVLGLSVAWVLRGFRAALRQPHNLQHREL